MFDFTLKIYRELLLLLSSLPCELFDEFGGESDGLVLRNDVDKRPGHALLFAKLQQELGVRGIYYFRIVPASFHPRIIEQIAAMGHEIGYHYEDLTLAAREKGRAGRRLQRRPEAGVRRSGVAQSMIRHSRIASL